MEGAGGRDGMKGEKGGPGGRVRHRVSLVLTLIDDFSDRVIVGSAARAWIPGENPPVRKAEGCFVFTNLAGSQVRVLIEGGYYESRSLLVGLDGEAGYAFRKVRLTPNRSYPIPRHTTCVEGRAEPGSLIRILSPEAGRPLRLVYDYLRDGGCGDGGRDAKSGPGEGGAGEISLYHPEGLDVEGKELYIENSKSGAEFFRVLQRNQAGGAYLLERPLSRDYKKIGSAVYPVYSARADHGGAFFLPIPRVDRDKNRFLCQSESGGSTLRLEREFRTGAVNNLDFTRIGD